MAEPGDADAAPTPEGSGTPLVPVKSLYDWTPGPEVRAALARLEATPGGWQEGDDDDRAG
jgi:hypothetical protein